MWGGLIILRQSFETLESRGERCEGNISVYIESGNGLVNASCFRKTLLMSASTPHARKILRLQIVVDIQMSLDVTKCIYLLLIMLSKAVMKTSA